MKRWSFLPVNPIPPWWWLPVAVALVAVDFATGLCPACAGRHLPEYAPVAERRTDDRRRSAEEL